MANPRYEALFDPERSPDDFSGGMDGESPPAGATVWLFKWRIREAVLGVLIHMNGPMTIGQILADLEHRRVLLAKQEPRKVLSDVLRHQVRAGRVRRVGRGTYEIRRVPRTTAWRYRTRLLNRSWDDTTWELTDSRRSYDVPLPPEPAAAAEAEAWVHADGADIRRIAEEWALRSGLWQSDS